MKPVLFVIYLLVNGSAAPTKHDGRLWTEEACESRAAAITEYLRKHNDHSGAPWVYAICVPYKFEGDW